MVDFSNISKAGPCLGIQGPDLAQSVQFLNFEHVCNVSKAGPGLGIQGQGPQGAGQDRPSLAALDIIDKLEKNQ